MEIKKEQIHPSGYFLLIEPLKKPIESGSGLVLPENMHQSMPMIGSVLEVGPKIVPRWWQFWRTQAYYVGDILMFRRYSVDELETETSMATKEKVYFVSTNPNDEIIIAKIDQR